MAMTLKQVRDVLARIVSELDTTVEPSVPSVVDIRGELPRNVAADNPGWSGGADWAIVNEKTAITLHHVGAENTTPHGVAAWTCRPYREGGKGLPRLQYHYWVSREGIIYYCVDEKFGFWHDHCGYPNSHLSIVMDGNLAKLSPSNEQLEKTAGLLYWLMEKYRFTQDELKGHCDYTTTICPGWNKWETTLRGMIDGHSIESYSIQTLDELK